MIQDRLKDILRPPRNYLGVLRVVRYDMRTFLKGYSPNARGASFSQLSSHLILHSHALEKAMSRGEFQPNRGKSALIKLKRAMDEYSVLGYDEEAFAFRFARSSIVALKARYEEAAYDIAFLKKHLGRWVEGKNPDEIISGAVQFSAKDKKSNQKKSFADIIQGRYSVREYADKVVSIESVRQAVGLAQKAPSVCNRQSGRVYIMTDEKLIKSVLAIHSGFKGYKLPPVLLCVVGDNSRFLESKEFGQANIDGGLFAMSLLLALEYQGLAACPLNAMFSVPNEKKVRGLVGINEGESLIMFMTVGHFKEKNIVAMSSRYPVDEVMTVVGHEQD